MKKAYINPPIIIMLSILLLIVAAVIFLNAKLLKSAKNPPIVNFSPTPISTPAQSTPPQKINISDIDTAIWLTYKGVEKGVNFSFKYPESMFDKTIKEYKEDTAESREKFPVNIVNKGEKLHILKYLETNTLVQVFRLEI